MDVYGRHLSFGIGEAQGTLEIRLNTRGTLSCRYVHTHTYTHLPLEELKINDLLGKI